MEAGRVSVVTAPGPWAARPSRRAVLLGVALVLVANAPLVIWASAFHARGAGDARTHAMLAASIARHGLSHGWTDAYGGGFPLGPHYPLVGWVLAALLVKLGLAPMAALDVLGFLAVLGAPLVAYGVALRAGARLSTALACALFLSWVTPGGYFVGGYEAFYGLGLFSQVLAIPAVVWLMGAVARDGLPWRATLAAMLAVACHPQIALASLVVLSVAALASGDRGVFLRTLRAGAAMAMLGAAVYGPGIATLKVPFGWPPMETWRTLGFGADRLAPWFLDGQLLDVGRAPILTALWVASWLVCLALRSRRAARAVAVASFVTVTLSVSGGALRGLGHVGAFLLSFLQPLRVLALVPLVSAATVLVALEEGAPFVAARHTRVATQLRAMRAPWMGAASSLQGLALALFACVALPSRFDVAELVRHKVAGILGSFLPGDACGPPSPSSSSPSPVKSWVSSLGGGRLWYDDTSARGVECEFSTGFEIDASVPVAVTSGVGAHVGVLEVAFHELAPTRAGSPARAEALGVRHALLFTGPPTDAGWDVIRQRGDVVLAERLGGTDVVGVGCVVRTWAGSNDALQRRLFADLSTNAGADALLDPHALVALETTAGAWSESERDPGECSAQGAHVTEHPREPGALEADVETPSPVDVVLRVTAFPTWRVRVDGREVPTTTVAPGFPSVRVTAGRHRVEAIVSPLRGYFAGIALALLGGLLCSVPFKRRG
jgi:hypothetical protein